MNLKGKNVLVVGGGVVASRKIKTLLLFEPRIRVVTKRSSDFIRGLAEEGSVSLSERPFEKGDLEGNDLVVVAVDDIGLQASIFKECLRRGIPVNCVDSPKYCSFIFPSVVVRGALSVGISTSGRAPAVSKRIRELVEGVLPPDIGNVVEEVAGLRKSSVEDKERVIRETVRKRIP